MSVSSQSLGCINLRSPAPSPCQPTSKSSPSPEQSRALKLTKCHSGMKVRGGEDRWRCVRNSRLLEATCWAANPEPSHFTLPTNSKACTHLNFMTPFSLLGLCLLAPPPVHVRSTDQMAAVAEWYRHRIMAGFVTSSSPVPLKTRRVGQRCTLNLSRAETSSRWCDVVVRRGGCQLRCRPRHLTMVQNYVVRRQKPSCS
ncbi:uncharacterized protein TNCV_4085841 [Trichonephila clavipes]|nr:uncharacterized protein TNCV_4085841 [Trichonephila clavipes]